MSIKLPTGQIQGSRRSLRLLQSLALPFHSASGSPVLIPNGSLPLLPSILGVFHFLKAERLEALILNGTDVHFPT